MSIKIICNRDKLEETIIDLLSPQRKPRKVQIVAPFITDFKIRGYTFLKMIERLLQGVEGITIVLVTSKPILRNPENKTAEKQIKQRKDVIKKLEGDLSEIAIPVKVHQTNKKLHAKLILVEKQSEKLFLMGSSNYTHGGIHVNNEVNVCIRNENHDYYDELDDYITRICKNNSTGDT